MPSSAKCKTIFESFSGIPDHIVPDVTESDEAVFLKAVSEDIDDRQKEMIRTPPVAYPGQESVLAVHWHPEFVPLELIQERIDAMFPSRKTGLFIPTQHNEIMSLGAYAGVEVDCYSPGFNQKIQLLLHFEKERVEQAHVLKEMLAHTFRYRSSQLFDFIRTITRPVEDRLETAARETGASEALIRFVRTYAAKVEKLLDRHGSHMPLRSFKNKLLRDFFDGLRSEFEGSLIDRAQTFLTAVKRIVKLDFPLTFFYRTREIIEEARRHNAGIVIPHPEQFWPVLLADYDVDGVEVWNPQSRRYTEFLVSVITERNRRVQNGRRPLLIFMGDDTHMGEKTRPPGSQNMEKANREIGYQPAWEDFSIRKALIRAKCSREKVIEEYTGRLAG